MKSQSDSTRSAADAALPDDPRLMEAVQEYHRRLEAGERPQRQELLGRYADIARPLAECLDGLDLLHNVPLSAGRAGAAPPARQELPSEPLGDFRIVRELGRGGMGIVYEAVQMSLGRRVALKVLPFAATLDAKHLQRFHNEATAAAQLHHTNIVPVYYVGCERGVNFYAMQLIDGLSLATVIEQVRLRAHQPESRRDSPSARLLPRTQVDPPSTAAPVPDAQAKESLASTLGSKRSQGETVSRFSLALSTQRSDKHAEYFRAAARLMLQAAEALEHAHEGGIVHRDIKPANLLVDGQGRLWVTDFGVAQFHAQPGITQTGDLIGTLRYMSPEQASGQRVLLDHRTDVYALGATLYELATLEPIFPGQNRAELLHQILHDEPRLPRAVDPTVPVELETIILKAVSKSPAERYDTARAFAADLQRYLDDKPILARRPTLIERARKWSRRHPAVLATAVVLLILSTAGLLISNWLIAREQGRTQAALKNEKQRAAEARRALDLLVAVSEEQLADYPHLQSVRRRLLETALTYYQDFIDAHGGDPAAQAELEAEKKRVRSILDELATLQGIHLIALATDPDVHKDLKLADVQRSQLTELDERSREQRAAHFRDKRDLAPEARRQKFYELAKAQEAALGEILQPAQLVRLRQIELQLQGPRAFHDSYAVEALKLTPEQRRQIRSLREETVAVLFTSAPEKGRPGEGLKREQIEQLHKQEVARIVALLSPEQQERWQELTGAPFEGGPRLGGFGSKKSFGTRKGNEPR
jgi:serine/threonine protein kinase